MNHVLRFRVCLSGLLVLVACGTSQVAVASGPALKERLDIDPVLHGVWYVYATSDDVGKTTKLVKPPGPLCRVGSLSVLMLNGTEMTVARVAMVTAKDGSPGNSIQFTTGVIWNIVQVSKPGEPLMLAGRVFPGPGKAEVLRFVFMVRR